MTSDDWRARAVPAVYPSRRLELAELDADDYARPAKACTYCGRPAIARQMCDAHYKRWSLGKPLDEPVIQRWTDAEVEALRAAYGAVTVVLDEVASRLGRSRDAVCQKAAELGLTDQSRPKSAQVSLNFKTPLSPEELTARQSANAKRRIQENGHPRGMLGKKHTDKTKEAIAAKSSARWKDPNFKNNSPEHRQALSDRMVANIAAGKMRSGFTRARGGRRADLGDVYFRSAWEADYARLLNHLVANGDVVSWEYEPKTFVFEAIKRGTRAYTPDFRVVFPDGRAEWHEVKGWMDPKSQTRLKRMAKYFPGETVVVRDAAFFRSVRSSGLAGVIHGWESKR